MRNSVRRVSFGFTVMVLTGGLLLGIGIMVPLPVEADPGVLHEASLESGDYGSGWAVAPTSGVVDTADGVRFVSTETDGRSNALVNWELPAPNRAPFRSHGTVSFMLKADREDHVSGEILGENWGYGSWCGGMSTFVATCDRIGQGTETVADDQVRIRWKTWHSDYSGNWYEHPTVTIEYGRWYHLGFTWGGATNDYEIWVCGALEACDSTPNLPWGSSSGTGSGTNVGLGSNHCRDLGTYSSAAGVMFSDIKIWDEYRSQGDTGPLPSHDITLAEGWNLISWPLVPDSAGPDDLFTPANLASGDPSNVLMVYYYDPGTSGWLWWNGSSASTLTSMPDGMACWVLMDAADTLTVHGAPPGSPPPSYDVVADWNMIGFTSTVDMAHGTYLADVAGEYSLLYGWDCVAQTWLLPYPAGHCGGMMTPGSGYWLLMDSAGTISPP